MTSDYLEDSEEFDLKFTVVSKKLDCDEQKKTNEKLPKIKLKQFL